MDRRKIAVNDKVVKVFIYIALLMLAISIIVPVARYGYPKRSMQMGMM